jgi:hypothetical protein
MKTSDLDLVSVSPTYPRSWFDHNTENIVIRVFEDPQTQ